VKARRLLKYTVYSLEMIYMPCAWLLVASVAPGVVPLLISVVLLCWQRLQQLRQVSRTPEGHSTAAQDPFLDHLSPWQGLSCLPTPDLTPSRLLLLLLAQGATALLHKHRAPPSEIQVEHLGC
jgi:hypothetical protein